MKTQNQEVNSFLFIFNFFFAICLFVDFVLYYFSELLSLREDVLKRKEAQVDMLEELPRRKHLG